MSPHVCPWWGGYFIDNRFRRLLHKPEVILADHVRPGMTAMDVGCGMGFFSIPMARLVGTQGRVISVDLQQKMLDVLAQRAQAAGVLDRIKTHCCQAESIGVTESVDFALAFYSAHEVPDQRRLLDDVYGCLRPGGHFLVVEPIGHVRASAFEKMLEFSRDVGFGLESQPRVRMSHTALLAK